MNSQNQTAERSYPYPTHMQGLQNAGCVERTPSIPKSLENLEKTISDLGEAWTQHLARIASVIVQTPTSREYVVDAKETPFPIGTQIGDRVDTMQRQLNRILVDISSATSRVEL